MKHCPKCNSLMPPDVVHCIKCGFDSAPIAASPKPKPAIRPVTPVAAQGASKQGKFGKSWVLARQSFRVLLLDKELLVFPFFSGIACIMVMASFVAGLFGMGVMQKNQPPNDALVWVLCFLYYFANYFVIVFFNSALVACAMIRFRGGNPTVSDGLRAARERLPQIIAWALLAATVGMVLRFIAERVQLLGRFVIAIIGAAWTIAAYFVVPVLVVEKVGPVDAVKRSVEIIKKTWGESLVANVGISAVTVLFGFLMVISIIIGIAVLFVNTESIAVVYGGVAVLVVMLILLALVSSALGSILLSALYLYATESKLPEAFEGTPLAEAFAAKA